MSIRNRNLPYRPLIAGVAIFNPVVNKLGTLGMIHLHDGKRWIVSCYHVLCRADFSPFEQPEPIFQPFPGIAAAPVAFTDPQRASSELDCAAAFVVEDLRAFPVILELGFVGPPTEPAVGMRVLKSGITTGVTEGEITNIDGDRLEIGVPQDFPTGYDLSDPGDSGALWVERDTRRAVALHTGGNDTGTEKAFGVRLQTVLEALDLG